MIQPNEDPSKAIRAVFFMDPEGTIRAIIYYPLSMGRIFDELYRALIVMRTADAFDCITPADWQPGDDVIVPPAVSCGTAENRMEEKEEGVECVDWFFCTKKTVLKNLLKE